MSILDAEARADRMVICKAVCAVLVNFHPQKAQLLNDLQGGTQSDELKSLWVQVGEIAGRL